jgi:hypothetical protein
MEEGPKKSYMIRERRVDEDPCSNPWANGNDPKAWRRYPLKNLYSHGRDFELSKQMYGTWLLWDPEGDWDWPEKYWWGDWDKKTCALKLDTKIAVYNSWDKEAEKRAWKELMDDRKAWEKGLKGPRPRLLKKIGQAVNGMKGIIGTALRC